ncbi:MAG TPA: SIS domain-containing protein, partial [Thermomicrobiales bacterium]|nr:SIS domain-containing protein [Thermomicrobiales bacterium]
TVDALDTDALFFTSLETPGAIQRVVTELEPAIADIAAGIAATQSPRLYFLGGGASLAAMLGGQYLLDRFTSVPSEAATGWQFLSRQPHAVDENAIVVLTSYSGETPEILEAKRFAEARGAKTIAITNTPATPLAQGATAVFDYHSKAVFTAPLAIVYLLAARIMEQRGENAAVGSQIAAGLADLPAKMALQAEQTQKPAKELAAAVGDIDVFYVVASGPNYGLGYKLALSVIIENLWKDAVPVDAGEFYHGPIEIVPRNGAAADRRAFLHLVGTDLSRAVSEQAIAFCRKMGSRQLIFDAAGYPEFGELFAPFALFVPTEWWVMAMAAQKGHDVDERRWMGKIGARWGEYA